MTETVLMTGGEGFIGSRTIIELLKRGYAVRTTVRRLADVAHVLRSSLGASAKKVPTRPMPDFVLRIVALFQRPVRFALPPLGRKHVFSAAKAKAALGWEPRPATATIIDSAHSVIAIGAV